MRTSARIFIVLALLSALTIGFSASELSDADGSVKIVIDANVIGDDFTCTMSETVEFTCDGTVEDFVEKGNEAFSKTDLNLLTFTMSGFGIYIEYDGNGNASTWYKDGSEWKPISDASTQYTSGKRLGMNVAHGYISPEEYATLSPSEQAWWLQTEYPGPWEYMRMMVPANSEKCGDNLVWTFDPDTETLAITGSGPMYDYKSSDIRWGGNIIKSVFLPAGVTSIGDFAFFNCGSLQSISFDDNSQLESIGTYAFSRCTTLQSIDIPDSVTSMGDAAFYYCISLHSVILGDNSNLKSIGDGAFSACKSLQSIDIPASVTSIGSDAFWYCTSLESVKFGDGSQLGSIGNDAFEGCASIRSIDIPASVTSIGGFAFYPLHFMVDGTEVEQTASDLAGRYWMGTGDTYLYLTVIPSESYIDSSSDMYRGGDIVTFTLGFTGVEDAKSILFTFSCGGSSAEMVGYRWLVPAVIQQFDGLEGIAAWSDAKDIDGGVFEISFRLSEDADEFTLSCDSMINPGDMSFAASKTIYRQLYIDGDLDDDGLVTSDDAIYLLYSTFLPDRYPLNQDADFNDDGIVDSDDAVYLLYHTFLPDRYPLHPKSA
jgi:hypothetical protein